MGAGRLYAALRHHPVLAEPRPPLLLEGGEPKSLISGFTHERMGEPDGYLLLVERNHPGLRKASAAPPFEGGELIRAIGLKAAVLGRDGNAVRVSRRKTGKGNKNRTIFVRPLLERFGIGVERTVVFKNCRIDRDGVLVLELGEK